MQAGADGAMRRLLFAESDPVLAEADYDKESARLRVALLKAQYAQLNKASQALLIVAAGIDGAGKGATINLLNEWMDPRHIHTLAFDSKIDGVRPPMWRYWDAMPARGKTGIVFGSWYEPLLAETKRKKPRESRIAAAAASICAFERMLADEGVRVVKLWFHLSKPAQEARTKKRLADPATAWRVTRADRKVPGKFRRLRDSAAMAIDQTDTTHAPWIVIPSACDPLRAACSGRALLDSLRPARHTRPAAPVEKQARSSRDIPARLNTLDYAAKLDKAIYEQRIGILQGRLADAARRLRDSSRALVLVFEGQDAAGKGGAIRRVTPALDVRQYDIAQIAAPSDEELAHPYLWRFWRRVPAAGRIAIFDRSWYGRVLVERVEGYAKPRDWRRAYGEINAFESQLIDNHAIVLKFWLAVSKDEQLERFKEREKSPVKRFKITPDDWRNRKKWDAYVQAADEMFARTDTPACAWHVVSGNDKHYARLHVIQHIVHTLEQALDRS